MLSQQVDNLRWTVEPVEGVEIVPGCRPCSMNAKVCVMQEKGTLEEKSEGAVLLCGFWMVTCN